MVETLLRGVLGAVARALKGPRYRIDSRIPLSALVALACRRGVALLRGLGISSLSAGRVPPIVFVGRGTELRTRAKLRLGRGVTIGRYCLIDALSDQGVELGANSSIGDFTIIEATGVITDLGVGVRIGANSGLGAYSFIGGAGGVTIGSNVIMGQRVSFHSENHHFERLDVPIRLQGVHRQGIVIEDDCWVGANVTFLDGARVGQGCVIAAGSVVRGEVPPYSVVAGVPGRVVRSRKQVGAS